MKTLALTGILALGLTASCATFERAYKGTEEGARQLFGEPVSRDAYTPMDPRCDYQPENQTELRYGGNGMFAVEETCDSLGGNVYFNVGSDECEAVLPSYCPAVEATFETMEDCIETCITGPPKKKK